jgi:acyl-CoA synthetase (AMP-forming)/AMP-acid ligase II
MSALPHPDAIRAREFANLADLIKAIAEVQGARPAVIDPVQRLSYAELDGLVDRIAARLQQDGVGTGDSVALCGAGSATYVAAYLGALRAGAAAVPLAISTPQTIAAQIVDCRAKVCVLDASIASGLEDAHPSAARRIVAFDQLDAWLGESAARPAPHSVTPSDPFNIIYSSGTTGAPKGIVQSHGMRWAQIRRSAYPGDAVTLVSTPLYSNTTLVSLLPTLAAGGSVVLLPKFDVDLFLSVSERERVTHAMLVPVQVQRLLAHPEFDRFDLSAYRMKFVTSAPFAPPLKEEALRRWPGGLIEFYGMTEGGGMCALHCHKHPDKLHTVGRPLRGHEIIIIDETGSPTRCGEIGEVVGRSDVMMSGYHNQARASSDAEWFNPQGQRYIRTGDLGRFDEDGFLVLVGRKKEMIISGGFNIFPSDLEAQLLQHAAVANAAVVGVASERWGETPVAFVTLDAGQTAAAEELMSWANARLAKPQRISALHILPHLPRSPIGKVLKQDLRAQAEDGTHASSARDGQA